MDARIEVVSALMEITGLYLGEDYEVRLDWWHEEGLRGQYNEEDR